MILTQNILNVKFVGIQILVLFLLIVSCNNPLKDSSHVQNTSTSAIVHGHKVLVDSIKKPEVIYVDGSKLKTIKAGKPIIKTTNSNILADIKSTRTRARQYLISTPGKESFQLPETLEVKKTTLPVSRPEIVIAKDRVYKDNNAYSFSSFGKLQGLKHNVI
jgi:hypothetical protein